MTLVADCNHNNPIDFAKVKASGMVGGFIFKATQGVGFTDPLFARRAAAARYVGGLEVGAYDFNCSDDIAADVAKFFDVVKPDPTTLMVLDFERNPASDMTLPQALEFLDRGDQKLGRPLALYGGDKIKREIVTASAAERDFLARHPLWGCEYGPVWKNLDVNGHPLPWRSGPDLWQKWADGYGPNPPVVDGLEAHGDFSVFAGDRAALAAWWAGGRINPPVGASERPAVASNPVPVASNPAADALPGDPLIAALQNDLIKLGYDPGRADGLFGARTQTALQAWQRTTKRVPSGVADHQTLTAVRFAAEAAA